MPRKEETEKEWLTRYVGALKTERSSFDPHWKELAEHFQPRRGRFNLNDRNRGEKRHQAIINSHGTLALRTACAGMFAGIMSPARPWFSLTTPDPDMMEFQPVKEWLFKVEKLLNAIFNQSNLYNMAPTMIGEMLLFGTGCMTHVTDFEDVARFYTHTVGSYMIAQDERYRVNTLVREFEWTVEQVVNAFGLEKVSTSVKNMYDRGDYSQWVPIVHCAYPNRDYQPKSPMPKNRLFASTYYEPGNGDRQTILRKSGFKRFPAYAPRWQTTNEDVYGTECPGMIALGDVKSLQVMQKRMLQAVEKMVNPPLHGPAAVRNSKVSALPGGLTVYDATGTQKLETIYDVNMNLEQLGRVIEKTERLVDMDFYTDLFMAISNMEGIQPRNEFEIMQRNQERLLQLGPVLERAHGEFLAPLIDNTFEDCAEAGILPEPPQELENQPLKTEFVSSLAQAQRVVGMGAIDRLIGMAGNAASLGWTQALDKVDVDQAIDEASAILGTPPRLVVSDDVVQQRRQERQAQQQQAQQMEQAQMGAAALQQGAQGAKAIQETRQLAAEEAR